MRAEDAIASRYLRSVVRRSAATRRLLVERSQETARDYLAASMSEARAASLVLGRPSAFAEGRRAMHREDQGADV